MNRHHGFTLIELMIVLMIIGILTTISLPSYLSHLQRSRRTEAMSAILEVASRQARYYSMNNHYTLHMEDLGYSSDPYFVPSSSNPLYSISVVYVNPASDTTPATMQIQAVPQGSQAEDTCGTFLYTDLGERSVSGMQSSSSCWGR